MLPQHCLQSDFKVILGSVVETSLRKLQRHNQRIYDDIIAYTLNPFRFPEPISVTSMNKAIPKEQNPYNAPLYWQRLFLSDGSLCSEVVLISWQSATYLAYLKVLPDTFGLFSPLNPHQAMQFVNRLVEQTLENIKGMTMVAGNQGIVATLYNPNLAAMFVQQGYKKDPEDSQIEGLPLPANYFLDLSKQDQLSELQLGEP